MFTAFVRPIRSVSNFYSTCFFLFYSAENRCQFISSAALGSSPFHGFRSYILLWRLRDDCIVSVDLDALYRQPSAPALTNLCLSACSYFIIIFVFFFLLHAVVFTPLSVRTTHWPWKSIRSHVRRTMRDLKRSGPGRENRQSVIRFIIIVILSYFFTS